MRRAVGEIERHVRTYGSDVHPREKVLDYLRAKLLDSCSLRHQWIGQRGEAIDTRS